MGRAEIPTRSQHQIGLLDDIYQAVTDYLKVESDQDGGGINQRAIFDRMALSHARVKRSAFMSQTTVDI